MSRREFMKAPILTNTTLTVLRQCGKYVQMSRLLRPIAFEVIVCMSQLFDYYLFAVHTFFTADLVRRYRQRFMNYFNHFSLLWALFHTHWLGKGKGHLWVLQHCCLEAYCTLTWMSSFIHLQRRCTHQAAWETSASEGMNYTWNLASNP